MNTEHNQNRRAWVRLAALLLVGILTLIGSDDSARAAGMLVADNGFGGVLEIVEHDVRVTINNGIAVTEVTQVFRNTEQRQMEALYTFPVPKGASVSNFSMWIGGKEMVGEVLEKERAHEIYNSYKRKKRDPGLLEQTDYKTFEMRIFPIGPGASQKVQITYYQELDFDHDWATYVYPLATTTNRQLDNRVRGKFAVSVDVKSSVPIAAIESPSHGSDFLFVSHSKNYSEASLENRDGDLARDVVLAFKVSRPVTGLDLITSVEAGEDGYFALTLRAGSELEKTQTGADYVFVLDISGSMANDSKLRTSVDSLTAFIKALAVEDRFEVITFNRVPNALFGKLEQAKESSFNDAVTFLDSREAKGGTLLQPALETAYKYVSPDRPLNVVILSDGMTEQNERRVLLQMIESRPANVRVFCIGVGNEINRSLLSQMAEDAGGLAAFLSRGDDFSRQAKAFQRKLMHPVAANLQLRTTGIDTYNLTPQKLPNLYYGMPVKIYGRYRGKGIGQVELTGEVNGRRIVTKTELDFPARDPDNPEIERMWAWHRMEELKRQHEIRPDSRLVDEIVRLGETYSITSEYTSFLVLENDAEFKRWKIERRNASRIKRDRAALARMHAGLEALRSKAIKDLGPTADKPATPVQSVAVNPVRQSPQPQPQPDNRIPQPVSRSADLPGFGGGGGAMDPVSGLICVALAGGAALGRKKKK
ncbi:MAG: VIT and VWA domain-containing protein [Deltaproteobacteria bacterium]